ncbi:MAG: hypothetical protein ABI947_19850 [Chloroflexota bacterium]
MTAFNDLLATAQADHQSTLAVGLAPVVARLPYEIQRYDDPFLPFGKAVIDSTIDLVCAYVFHLGAYLALGAAGAVALERTLAYVPTNVIRILHGPFATAEYVQAAFEDAFDAHAVTLAAEVSPATIAAYTQQPQHGVFVRVPADFDLEAFLPIAAEHPGQVGLYHHTKTGGVLELLADSPLEIHWHSDLIYSSQQTDFREAIHAAASKLRQPPQKHQGLA